MSQLPGRTLRLRAHQVSGPFCGCTDCRCLSGNAWPISLSANLEVCWSHQRAAYRTVTALENPDVLPAASVAVAVTFRPAAKLDAKNVKDPDPFALVVTWTKPRYVFP